MDCITGFWGGLETRIRQRFALNYVATDATAARAGISI